MASLSRKVVQQHNSLLIKLCDMMSPDDPAYKNFILCLQLYIPKGRLSMVQQNPLDVLVLMEERGILKVGKYQVLEKALKDSGYINVLDCLMMEEKSIARQMGQHSCSDGAMAGGSSNIEAVTASSIEPEDQLDQNIIKLEKKMIQEVEARISRKADQVSKEKMESGPKGQKRRLNYNQDKPASKKFMSKKQGTHGSMSTHRFRTEILTEAKKKHNQLYVILHDLITEDSFKRIIRMARTYIDPKTLEEVKDMFHLLLCLEVKGVVSVGKYDNLVEIMNNAGVQNGLDVVLMTARDIKDIQQEESEMSRLDAYIWNQDRIHLSPGKLHQTVLNQCLPVLLKDLDFKDILDYMTNEDLMDFVTMHDILEQRTASAQIMELIKWVQERDQDTYEKFKECLVLSKQTHLKDMLEEEEAVVAIEVNEKHEGTALGCRFSLDNIGKAWKSIKTELKDKFYPRSILLSFTKQGILSDDEAKAICPKTMREMSEEILQRVEENLPDAFFVLLKALRDTDQDRAAKMMIKIINGTYVSKTTEELSCIPSSSVVIENILDKDIVKQETQKPEVKTIKGDGNEFGDLEEGTATGCSFALEDIRKAWKSIKTKLLQEFYPKSIFAFFIKEGILSDEECQAMNEKTRREMTEEILQRVEEKLPDAFFVLLKALRDTDQDKAADMMIKIINGTYVSKTTGHGQHLCLDVQKNRIVSEEELSNMSSHIGKEWEFLGRVLGITEAKLEQIKEDSLNTRECIYQMLMAWKGLSAENATISVLQSAIQKSGIVVDTVRINNILDGSVFVPMGIRK